MSNRPPFNINLHLGIEYEPTYYDDGQAADVATEFWTPCRMSTSLFYAFVASQSTLCFRTNEGRWEGRIHGRLIE